MYKKDLVFNLENQRKDLEDMIEKIDHNLLFLKKGTLVKQNNYYYVKYYDKGKVVSSYVGKDLTDNEIDMIKYELRSSKTLLKRRKEYVKEIKEIEKLITKYGG